MVSIPNRDDMEIALCYMNEAYYQLNQFHLSQGTDLTFDSHFDGNNQMASLMRGWRIGKRKMGIMSDLQQQDPD